MATIKEIAALAGVSRGTVDRVLNHRGAVNSETAQKVKKIAFELNYKPNRAGLVLAAQKKKLKLGVILFSKENPFFIDVEEGVNEKATELAHYNCQVLIKYIPNNIEAQFRAIKELVAEDINGIALSPFNDDRIRHEINTLFESGIPTITFNTDIENSKRIAYVGSHYRASGETAAGLMHLITQGQAHVGIVTGSANILCHTERIAGFTDYLSAHPSNIHICSIVENHDDEFESYDTTMTLLQTYPEINALFFSAAGVYGGCRAVLSLGMEEKIKIITFDKVSTTKDLIKRGIIAATICQQPMLQGSKPLAILFSYLSTGELPEKEYNYTSIDIRIRENIEQSTLSPNNVYS